MHNCWTWVSISWGKKRVCVCVHFFLFLSWQTDLCTFNNESLFAWLHAVNMWFSFPDFSILLLGDVKTRYHVNGWGTWSLHTNYCSSCVPCWSWGLSTTLLGSSICTCGARSHVSSSQASYCHLSVNVSQVVTSLYVGAFCSVNMYVCHSLFVRPSGRWIIKLNSPLVCLPHNWLFRSDHVSKWLYLSVHRVCSTVL